MIPIDSQPGAKAPGYSRSSLRDSGGAILGCRYATLGGSFSQIGAVRHRVDRFFRDYRPRLDLRFPVYGPHLHLCGNPLRLLDQTARTRNPCPRSTRSLGLPGWNCARKRNEGARCRRHRQGPRFACRWRYVGQFVPIWEFGVVSTHFRGGHPTGASSQKQLWDAPSYLGLSC